MAFTKIDHIRINQFKVAMHQYFIPNFFFTFFFVNENITFSLHDGKIWKHLLHRLLIWHLCEHDIDILFTSAFKMAESYRFIQICLHGTSKKA